MITAEEALEIYRKKYPGILVFGGERVEGFGYLFESNTVFCDDSAHIVSFDGKIELIPSGYFAEECNFANLDFAKAKKKKLRLEKFDKVTC